MIIKIVNTWDKKFIPKRRFLCFWYQVSEFEFMNENACRNWLMNTYVPQKAKARSSNFWVVETVYNFTPDYRDRIDKDFM
jgi:hypothetical protein